ncbi:MAG TPA: phosphoribosylformylglycinamidine synthase subunit PurS [Candidatus Omnitrophota bacterium]|nr:phosphoribosylformylglycinamidine synthase subunit PurS [Candidatus Omnitrophota bacterium]
MHEAKVVVTLKKSVSDPQGKAILNALHSLTFNEVQEVRTGKYFEIRLAGEDKDLLEGKVRQMCDQLLANPVIEEYSCSIEAKG